MFYTFFFAGKSINCYTDVRAEIAEDCGMHTGCMKKFDPKSKSDIFAEFQKNVPFLATASKEFHFQSFKKVPS